MHIAEGFLPASHAIGWTVAAAPFVVWGARSLVVQLREKPETGPLLAAAGAFTFVLSALKIPSVTGSSSHPTGTGLGAILFRPPVMAVLGTFVLLFQALLLAHGGITTLGANVFSMAVVGSWVGFGGYMLVRTLGAGLLPAVFVGAVLADWSTYVVTTFQLALAFPDAESGVAGSMVKFGGVFVVTQVPLAVIEGLLTVVVVHILTRIAAKDLRILGVLKAPAATPARHEEVSA